MMKKIKKDEAWYKKNGWEIVEKDLDFVDGPISNTIDMLNKLVANSDYDEYEIMVEYIDFECTHRFLWGKKKEV